MSPWRAGVLQVVVVAMSSMPQINCDFMSDPATRLSTCMEAAVQTQTHRGAVVIASCDLKIQGRYTIILHPPGEIGNDDLGYAGLPDALIPELRAMRLRSSPAIYVIATDRTVTGIGMKRSVQSSRTTDQSAFVQIRELMILTKNSQTVTVEIGRPEGVPVIQRIR